MVQVVMGFLDETPNLEVKLSVISTLRTVTEGKVSRTPSCAQIKPGSLANCCLAALDLR